MYQPLSPYIHNTKCALLNKPNEQIQELLIFLFMDSIILTKSFDEDDQLLNNPIVLNIKQDKIHKVKHDCESYDESNTIVISYYDDKTCSIKDIKVLFSFKKDSYFVYHFILKYNILIWQMFYENSLLQKYKKQWFNSQYMVKKANSKGKLQDRTLVLSNTVRYILSI